MSGSNPLETAYLNFCRDNQHSRQKIVHLPKQPTESDFMEQFYVLDFDSGEEVFHVNCEEQV